MIDVEAVSKSYGRCHAVSEVSLAIPAGTVTGLLGLNGAGKSTLLRLIAGLESPNRGTVSIDGRRLRDVRDPIRLVGAHFGPGLLDPRHTVVRHLRWLAALGGIEAGRVDTVLDLADLTALSGRRIGGLSLGARQRVAIAGALLGDPDVLVLDEPVNGLDVPGIVWLRQLLRDLAARGRLVIVASHVLAEVVLSADRVVIMSGGRIAVDGPLADVVPAGVDPREHLEQALTGGLGVAS
jgi:ABC-2 type transport system ATP-binding protein